MVCHVSSSSDVVWVVRISVSLSAEYPMLFYLDTGETEDFLASTGAKQLEYAYDYSWSENMRRANQYRLPW